MYCKTERTGKQQNKAFMFIVVRTNSISTT